MLISLFRPAKRRSSMSMFEQREPEKDPESLSDSSIHFRDLLAEKLADIRPCLSDADYSRLSEALTIGKMPEGPGTLALYSKLLQLNSDLAPMLSKRLDFEGLVKTIVDEVEELERLFTLDPVLTYAIFSDEPEAVLVAKGTSGETLLTAAIKNDCPRVIEELLLLGSSVNERNSRGENALTLAIELNKTELALRLLKFEACTDILSPDGKHLVFAALRTTDIDLFRKVYTGIPVDTRQKLWFSLVEEALSINRPALLNVMIADNHRPKNISPEQLAGLINNIVSRICTWPEKEIARVFQASGIHSAGHFLNKIATVAAKYDADLHEGLTKQTKDFFNLLSMLNDSAADLSDHELSPWGADRTIAKLAKESGDFSTAMSYVESLRDVAKNSNKHKSANALTVLAPHLLFHYPPEISPPIANCFRVTLALQAHKALNGYPTYGLGNQVRRRELLRNRVHVNEAEMMLLLRHPANQEIRSAFVSGLAELTEFKFNYSRTIPGQLLNSWSTIGRLTFSFQFWRFDACSHPERPESSLLEQFGFKRLQRPATDQVFGPGFVLQARSRNSADTKSGENFLNRVSPGTRVELRRGYLHISNPEHGTLIIRNSSRVFGRDLLDHPAYWSPQCMNKDAVLQALDKPGAGALKLYHVLDASMYTDHKAAVRNMSALVAQLTSVKDEYSRWKFDTAYETAWNTADEVPYLVGGFHSPGFEAIVDYLSALQESADRGEKVIMPDLAFVHPDYPPWSPYNFEVAEGVKKDRLKVNPEVLEALRKLSEASADEDLLRSSAVRSFLQQAGFSKEAELVMLAPEE